MKKKNILRMIVTFLTTIFIACFSLSFTEQNKVEAKPSASKKEALNEPSGRSLDTGVRIKENINLVQSIALGNIYYYEWSNANWLKVEGDKIRFKDDVYKPDDLGSETETGAEFKYFFNGEEMRFINLGKLELHIKATFNKQAVATHKAGFKVHYFQDAYTPLESQKVYMTKLSSSEQTLTLDLIPPKKTELVYIDFFNHGSLGETCYVKNPTVTLNHKGQAELLKDSIVEFIKENGSTENNYTVIDEMLSIRFKTDILIDSGVVKFGTDLESMELTFNSDDITEISEGYVYTKQFKNKRWKMNEHSCELYIKQVSLTRFGQTKTYKQGEFQQWSLVHFDEKETLNIEIFGPDGINLVQYTKFNEKAIIKVPKFVGYSAVKPEQISIRAPYENTPYTFNENGDIVIDVLRNSLVFDMTADVAKYKLEIIDREEIFDTYYYNIGDLILVRYPVPKRDGYIFTGYTSETGTKLTDETGTILFTNTTWLYEKNIKIYANWRGSDYNLIVQRENQPDEVIKCNHDYYLPEKLGIPSKKGYEFLGFYGLKDGKEARYYNAEGFCIISQYNGKGDLTIYPLYEAITYYVTLDKGNGENNEKFSIHYLDKLPDLEVIPTKKGHTFVGYFDKTNEISQILYYNADGVGTTFYGTTNLYLEAKWEGNHYNLTLIDPDKPEDYEIVNIEYGHIINITLIPDKTGADFVGCFTEPNGKGIQYIDAYGLGLVPYEEESDFTLYYYYKQAEYSFIVYNQNGDEISNITYPYGATVNNIEIPVKPGYTFLGYGTAEDGTGFEVFDKNGIVLDDFKLYLNDFDVDIYAQWSANTYTVTFNPDNTLESFSFEILMDTPYPAIELPVKFGYKFLGYYLEENGAGEQIYDASAVTEKNFTAADNITLYGAFDPDAFNVTLDLQEGEGTTTSVEVKYEQALPKVEIPHKLGHDFVGFFTEPLGKGVKYYDEAGNGLVNYDKYEAITLYAYYTPSLITITLATGNIEVYYSAALPLKVEIPVKTGYTFKGYNTQENGEGTLIYDASGNVTEANTCTFSEDTKLFAMFKANSYTVSYDSNKPVTEGEIVGEMLNSNHVYDTESALTTNTFSLVGYIFKGWSTTADGEVEYTDGALVKTLAPEGTIILYAVWNPISYQIVFNKGTNPIEGVSIDGKTYDITGEMPNMTVYYDETFKVPYTEFKLRGYLGHSWALKPTWEPGETRYEGNITELKNLTSTNGEVINLYTLWTYQPYYLIFDSTGGSYVSGYSTHFGQKLRELNGEYIISKEHLPKRTGYKFVGFVYRPANGSEQQYVDHNGTVGAERRFIWTESTTLYAKWEALNYKLCLNSSETAYTKERIVTVENLVLDDITGTYKDYRFMGWSSLENQKIGEYKAGVKLASIPPIAETPGTLGKVDYVGVITLYAAWKYDYYNINYATETEILLNTIEKYGANVTIKTDADLDIVIPSGMYLSGWSPYRGSVNPIYLPGQVVNGGISDYSDVTLYPVFKEVEKYKVSYNANGGINAPIDNNEYLAGSEFTISSYLPVNVNYSFKGWTTNPHGEIVEFPYVDGSFTTTIGIMPENGITLYAVWLETINSNEEIENIKHSMDALHQALQTLDQTVNMTQEQLTQLATSIDEAKARIKALEDKIITSDALNTAKAELTDLIKQTEAALEKRIKALETNVTEILARLEVLDTNDNKFNATLKELSEKLEASKVTTEALDKVFAKDEDITKLNESLTKALNDATLAINQKLAELTKALAENNTKLEGLDASSKEIAKTVEALATRLEAAEKALEALDTHGFVKAEDLALAITEAKEEIATKVKAIEDNLNKATTDIAGLKTSDEEFTKSLGALTADLKLANEAISALEQNKSISLEAVNAAIEKANEVILTKIKAIEDTLANVTEEITSLKTTDAGFTKSLEALIADLKAVKDTISAIDKNTSISLEDVNKAIAKANETIIAQIKALEVNVKKATEDIAALKTTDAGFKEGIDKLAVSLKQANAAIEALNAKEYPSLEFVNKAIDAAKAEINTKITEIEETLAKTDEEIKALEAKDEEVLEKIEILTSSLENMTGIIDALSAKDLELEGKISDLSNEIKNLKTSLTNSIKEIKAELEGKIDDLNNKLDGIEKNDKNKTDVAAIVGTTTSSILLLVAAAGLFYFKKRH